MMIHSILFYFCAVIIIVATGMAITRRNLVHAIIYLIVSFFGSALLFYLFGAPFLAALEIIIYAGAIMVLFLFIIMMLKVGAFEEIFFPLRQWLPALILCMVFFITGLAILLTDSESHGVLNSAAASPKSFGEYVFQTHWLSIEIVSLLLLVVVIGAMILGMGRKISKSKNSGGTS